MTIAIIEQIRNHIAENILDQAIEVFRTYCTEFENELIIQSSKYNNLRDAIRQGIISREQSNLERNQLCHALLELLNEVDVKTTAPKNESHELSGELRDVLAFAELISRRKGKERTSTKDFFTALVSMKPDSLSHLITDLKEKKALPKSADSSLLELPRKLSNNRNLSACLTESLSELGEIAKTDGAITPADMFIDVSKFGKGKSVAKLRKHGIGRTEIDGYVKTLNLDVKQRALAA